MQQRRIDPHPPIIGPASTLPHDILLWWPIWNNNNKSKDLKSALEFTSQTSCRPSHADLPRSCSIRLVRISQSVKKKRARHDTLSRRVALSLCPHERRKGSLSLSIKKSAEGFSHMCVCVWGGKDHKSEIDLPPPCATIRDKGKKKKKGQKRCQKLYGNNTHGSLSRVSLLLRKSFRQKSESVQPMNGTSSIYI